MEKRFKSFYFLHIPKTGGRALREIVFDQLKNDLLDKGINSLSPIITKGALDSGNTEAHYGWVSTIQADTYVVTLLRDPIRQSVSLFSHIYDTDKNNLKKWGIKSRETDLSKISKYDYIDYVIKNKFYNNFQFKNIMSEDSDDWNELEYSLFKETFYNKKIGVTERKKIVEDRIKQCNIILDADNLTNEIMQKTYEKICNDLDINPSQLEFINTDVFKNTTSEHIYNQLDESEKNILRKILHLDYELYDNKDLFTKL